MNGSTRTSIVSRIPFLSNFQKTHIGTTVTGLSGILPYTPRQGVNLPDVTRAQIDLPPVMRGPRI